MDAQELKVRSFRADNETYDKFKQLAEGEFGNQGQCLSALINLYEVEKSKAILTNRGLEIESFQDYLNKISGLFLTSLQLNQDAEGRIREEFARQIESKDNTIVDLQSKITDLKITNESNGEQTRNLKEQNNELLLKVASLEKTIDKQNKDYSVALADKDSLNKALTDSCNEKKFEIETLKAIIKDSSQKLNNLKTIEVENKKLSEMVSKLENDIEKQKELAELEKEKALLAAERLHQQELKETNMQHTEEIKEFMNKIDNLKDQQESIEKTRRQEIKETAAQFNEEIKDYSNKITKLQEQLDTLETAHHKEISKLSDQYNNKIQSLLEKIENIQETKTAKKVIKSKNITE
jgi:chromosome segregation ATPase